jgi:catechol 2,3-dioxygenase-like lactoylglutathione lyase family enzyme
MPGRRPTVSAGAKHPENVANNIGRPNAVLGAYVLFVRDLQESLDFYVHLLDAEIETQSFGAAILATTQGSHVVLREAGPRATHPLGGIGVQYILWYAASRLDLDEFESRLRRLDARVSVFGRNGIRVVEGRDPSGVAVMFAHPGPDVLPRQDIFERIYRA